MFDESIIASLFDPSALGNECHQCHGLSDPGIVITGRAHWGGLHPLKFTRDRLNSRGGSVGTPTRIVIEKL